MIKSPGGQLEDWGAGRIISLLDELQVDRLGSWGWAALQRIAINAVKVRLIYSVAGEPDVVDETFAPDTEWPAAYSGVAVEWAGPLVPDPGPWHGDAGPEWPCLRLAPLSEMNLALLGRHRAVIQTGRTSSARVRWHPQRPLDTNITTDLPHRDEDVLWAAGAFAVLGQIPAQIGHKRGRKGLAETQDRWRPLAERAEELKRQYPGMTWDHVAARIKATPEQLRGWRRELANLRTRGI